MADDADIKGHVATYDGLINILKYGAIAVFFIAFGVIWLISR